MYTCFTLYKDKQIKTLVKSKTLCCSRHFKTGKLYVNESDPAVGKLTKGLTFNLS